MSNKVIHKYDLGELHHNKVSEVEMPKGAKILSIQKQYDKAVVWAIVNPKHSFRKYTFHTFGTGFEMEDYEKKHYDYITTLQDGFLVWHIFEVHE